MTDFTEEELAAEEWRPVVGYEEYYHVSNLGRVKSLERVITKISKFGKVFSAPIHERLLKFRDSAEGYYDGVSFCVEGVAKSHDIHGVVMEAFKGPRPEGLHVCHEDNNGHNNRLGNLRYDTPKANMDDRKIHGTQHVGPDCVLSKLTADQVRFIRAMSGTMFQREIAKVVGVGKSTVQRVINRETYYNVPDVVYTA